MSMPKATKLRSQRDAVIADIYQVYTSENSKKHRKRKNWKLYIAFLKENRIKNTAQAQVRFKKTKAFIKEHDIRTIAIWLARHKVDGLYNILSEARDLEGRDGDAGGLIVGQRFI